MEQEYRASCSIRRSSARDHIRNNGIWSIVLNIVRNCMRKYIGYCSALAFYHPVRVIFMVMYTVCSVTMKDRCQSGSFLRWLVCQYLLLGMCLSPHLFLTTDLLGCYLLSGCHSSLFIIVFLHQILQFFKFRLF